MALNKSSSKSNMYKNHLTLNPIGGECSEHNCVYCYVNGMKSNEHIKKKYSGEPRLIEKEMKENLYKYGEGVTIFVQNMSDLFADNVPRDIIESVLEMCRNYPKNTYLFQTKNPKRFNIFTQAYYPLNTIKATTIESNRAYPEISDAPITFRRMQAMLKTPGRLQITMEPLLDFDIFQLNGWMDLLNPEIIYIGADSKKHKLPEPIPPKIVELYNKLIKKHNVVLKPNLRRIAPSLFSS